MTLNHMIRVAANLTSEDGENPEYDRALVELIVDTQGVGVDMDDGREIVQRMIADQQDRNRQR